MSYNPYEEAEVEELEGKLEQCSVCGTWWEDKLAAMTCPCRDGF